MRLAGALYLILAHSAVHASDFQAEALKCVERSDFDALLSLADRSVSSSSLDKNLKAVPGTGIAVDWSFLVRKVGSKGVNRVFGNGGAEFLIWLARRPDALEAFVHGGADGEVSPRSLELWSLLWQQFPESREAGPWQRFAIASALVQSQPVHAMADGKPIDPVARFQFFRKSAEEGALVPSFFQAPVWELRYVAGSWAMDSDLAWVRTAMKPEIRNQLSVGDACMMVPYIEKNAKGVSVQAGGKFYDDKPMTLQLMTEYGGVCGAISRFGASSAHALGVPAFPVAQPAHCAFVWKNADSSWRLGNDVFGWGSSSQHEGIRLLWGARPAFIPLYDMARRDEEAFLYAARLNYAASIRSSKISLLRSATEACPLFLPAWRQWVALEPGRLGDAARKLGVSPYAVSELFGAAVGDLHLRALRGIAEADPVPQLGTQTWASLEILSRKLRQETGKTFDVFGVIQCKEKRFKWEGTDAASQAIISAALEAVGARGDMKAQFEKLQGS